MSDNSSVRGKHTLVEEGTELKGTVSSKCPIVVMGKVEGEVSAPLVHVAPSGVVAGNVKATELRSAGEVAGEIEAETVTIAGRVRDRTVIRARTLSVTLSRETGTEVVFGECELAVGDEPDKQAAIEAAQAPVAAVPAKDVPAATTSKPAGRKNAADGGRDETAVAPPPVAASSSSVGAAASPKADDDAGPRKRKTVPPPMS